MDIKDKTTTTKVKTMTKDKWQEQRTQPNDKEWKDNNEG